VRRDDSIAIHQQLLSTAAMMKRLWSDAPRPDLRS
jgi:hypothetical protein